MNNIVYLICGVPGSGKTWVCEQLREKFTYVPHDEYLKHLRRALVEHSFISTKPLLTECPFAERELRERLEQSRLVVRPYFIVESPHVVKQRYEAREGKLAPQNILTRAVSIVDKVREWGAPSGTAQEVLALLKETK